MKNRIRQLRESRGWTQKYLGEKLNIKDSAISKYETGRAALSDETIVILTKLFNVSSDYLLFLSDTPNVNESTIPTNLHNEDKEYIHLFNYYEQLTSEHRYLILAQMIKYIQEQDRKSVV